MEFEFDPEKNAANLRKHGINFIEAQRLWLDSNLLQVPAINTDEPRFLMIGKIAGKNWSAIVTYRGHKVRLISVRRSRDKEVEIYESR